MVRQPFSTTNFRSDTATRQKWHQHQGLTNLTSTGRTFQRFKKPWFPVWGSGHCRQFGRSRDHHTDISCRHGHLLHLQSALCLSGGISSLANSCILSMCATRRQYVYVARWLKTGMHLKSVCWLYVTQSGALLLSALVPL